jgi:dihydroxy-acid dehydratase
LTPGTARVFDSQEVALSALEAQAIRAGDVAVLRGLGPVGGPGVASASWMAILHDKVHIARTVNAAEAIP